MAEVISALIGRVANSFMDQDKKGSYNWCRVEHWGLVPSSIRTGRAAELGDRGTRRFTGE